MQLTRITQQDHLDFVRTLPCASFLQCPSWGRVKRGWTTDSLGWTDQWGQLRGTALVLYKKLPGFHRFLAYVPEGPVIDWLDPKLDRWLDPLLDYLRSRKVFSVKMGPRLILRRWHADTVKFGMAEPTIKRLGDLRPDRVDEHAQQVVKQLRALGWRHEERMGGPFGDYQPRFVFELPLGGRTLSEVKAGFNSGWRRNIGKSAKAGVKVVEGGYDDLPVFHALLEVTGTRDGFRPRPLWYFQRQYQALTAENPDRMRLFLAQHEGETLAAATMLRVGNHVWYQSGGSADHGRDLRPSNALQWRMISEAHDLGAAVYDMRGISDTLDAQHPLVGLTRFKVGTGGEAAEYIGEWDFPLNRPLHKAVTFYLTRR